VPKVANTRLRVTETATIEREDDAAPAVSSRARGPRIGRVASAFARHWPLLLPLVAFATIVRAWFMPGLIAGEDFDAFGWSDTAYLRAGAPWPSAWDPTYGFGLNNQFWSTMFPILMVAGFLARAGASWNVIERVLFLFPLVVLIVCVPYAFTFRLLRDRWAATAAALLFAVNTWTIGLIERGHLPSLIAYALIPPVAFVCLRAVERPGARLGAWLALAAFASTLLEPRYTYMALLAGSLLWVCGIAQRRNPPAWRACAAYWGTFLAVSLGLDLYWILPIALAPISVPRSQWGLDSFLGQNATEDFVHGFAGFFPFYHHIISNDPFHAYPVEWPFLAFAACAVAGFALGWKSRVVRSFVPLWAGAVILASGAHSISGPFNVWVFLHVPGMTGFRDPTKWFALIEFAQAFGVAVFVHEVSVRVRLRRQRRIAAGLAVTLAAIWLAAMSDAFNPLRFSNFSATVPTAGDLRYVRFLAAEKTPGSVLYYPSLLPAFAPDVRHPGVEAFHLAQAFAPDGLGELNPNPSSMLAFFHSPLIQALLCQGGVRYVAVIPDAYSSLYSPFNRITTRGEALAYFRSVPWLKEVPQPAGLTDTSGDYFVFRVEGCERTAETAFVAPYPVAFNGSADSLTSLAGTPLWSNHAAVLLAAQQDPYAFRRAANVVNGVPYVSKDQTDIDDPATRALRSRLAQTSPIALYMSKPFEGFAFDQIAANDIFNGDLQSFDFSFLRAHSGVANVLLRIEPRTDVRGTLRSADFRAGGLQELPDSFGRELVDPKGFAVDEPLSGPTVVSLGRPGIPWMTGGSSGLTLDVINPLPVPAFADVELPGIVSMQADGMPLEVTLGESRAFAWAPPRFILDTFNYAPSVTLWHVLLPLGVSTLHVGPSPDAAVPPERRFAVSTGIAIANTLPATRFEQRWTTLNVGLGTSPAGTKVALSERFPSGQPGRLRFRLMSGLAIPLAAQPQVSLRYVAPRSPYSLRLAFGLTRDADRVEFTVTVPQSSDLVTSDLLSSVQRALDDSRDEQRRQHALDVRSLVESGSTAHGDASIYVLRDVELEIVKAGNAAASASTAIVRSATLDIPKSPVGAPIIHDVFVSDLSQPGAFRSLKMTNVHVERVDTTGSRLHLNLTVEPPPQLALPNDPHPGDHVTLQLQSGAAYSGTVVEATSDAIVLRQGTTNDAVASTIGIQRSSIATISQLLPNVQGGVAFDIPVRNGDEGSQLSFLLAANPLFTTKVTLLIRDPDTRRLYSVFPQDRGLMQSSEPQIPPQWISTVTNLAEIVPVPLGVPWFARDRPDALEAVDFQHYALDLPSIYASELPLVRRPQLVALHLEFALSGNATVTSPTPADITVANVELKRWTYDWLFDHDHGTLPRAQIDSQPLRYRIDGMSRTYPTLYAHASQPIAAGPPHVITATNGADSTIASAFLTFGTPVRTPFAALQDATFPSASEVAGRLQTGGGLLVFPRTYGSGWAAALLPSGVAPSGHALLDLVRLGRYFISTSDHVSVNDIFNGWYVPRFSGPVAFVFLPTAFGELGALLEAILLLAALGFLLGRRAVSR
jgi:hypothetical protein